MDENPTDPSFWTPLGGYTDPATLPNSTDDDSVAPNLPKTLFRISDTGGAVTFIEVTPSSGKLTKELLVSSDVFLLQSSGKIFLWIGKDASLTEKKEATPRALQVRVPQTSTLLLLLLCPTYRLLCTAVHRPERPVLVYQDRARVRVLRDRCLQVGVPALGRSHQLRHKQGQQSDQQR